MKTSHLQNIMNSSKLICMNLRIKIVSLIWDKALLRSQSTNICQNSIKRKGNKKSDLKI